MARRMDDFRNWLGWADRPRKGMKILEIGKNGGAGSGEIEMSHGPIEVEQLRDPERA